MPDSSEGKECRSKISSEASNYKVAAVRIDRSYNPNRHHVPELCLADAEAVEWSACETLTAVADASPRTPLSPSVCPERSAGQIQWMHAAEASARRQIEASVKTSRPTMVSNCQEIHSNQRKLLRLVKRAGQQHVAPVPCSRHVCRYDGRTGPEQRSMRRLQKRFVANAAASALKLLGIGC